MAKSTNRLRFGEAIGNEASLGRNAARRQMEAAARQASAADHAARQRDRLIAQNDEIIGLLRYVAEQMYAGRKGSPDHE